MLIDGLTAELGGPRTQRFLESVAKAIDIEALAVLVRDDLAPEQPRGGRPFWPVQIMIKCVLLAKWYGLSDPQLEEQLRDRLSFRRFVGLSLNDATPDETTFVKFRKRLRETGHAATLFEAALNQLRAHGLVLNEGSLVDATIVQAPQGGKNAKGESTRDRDATFTRKHGVAYHGYKAHVRVSLDRFILGYVFDTAKVHDSNHFESLTKDETKAVYADSAYMSTPRSEDLKQRGVRDGIVRRRVRGQKELTEEQKQHNRACATVRARVEHPFAMLWQMGYGRVRYRGLLRNAMDFGLTALSGNIKRALSLLGMPLTPPPRVA